MPREIKEADWKLLRRLHPLALERFCERALAEIESVKHDDARSFHQRYLASSRSSSAAIERWHASSII
jgi:hypothetical protein